MKRVNLDFSEQYLVRLDRMVEATGLKTRVAVFRSALALFEWYLRVRKKGGSVRVIYPDKTESELEFLIPGLEEQPSSGAAADRAAAEG